MSFISGVSFCISWVFRHALIRKPPFFAFRGFSLPSPPSPPGGLVIDSDSELGSDPISEVRDRSETGWLHRSTEASPTGESPTKTNQISWGLSGDLGILLGYVRWFCSHDKSHIFFLKKDEIAIWPKA